tara:strand:- start:1036 stop:1863 length:828 start_codon:yes stop_codon:yes gene_type:complete
MSYDLIEESVDLGSPVELFEFRYGDASGEIFRFTSADYDVVVGGETYTSLAIERDSDTQGEDPDEGREMTITLPRDNPYADRYRDHGFERQVTVKVRTVHLDDPAEETRAIYSGRVVDVSWPWPTMAISCEPMGTLLARDGGRPRVSRQCWHTVFDRGCGLNRANWEVAATVVAIDGLSVTLTYDDSKDDFDNGWWLGGIFEDGDGVMRYIVAHSGLTVRLNRPLQGLAVSDAVQLLPGCDRTRQTCRDKFDNRINAGSLDYLPIKGPYEGNSLV